MAAIPSIDALRMILRRLREEIANVESELAQSRNMKPPRVQNLSNRIEAAKIRELVLLAKLARFESKQ
jgi:hypothetical protein